MYLQYALIAFAVILVIALISAFLLKKAGLLDKVNLAYLIASTVLAMACAGIFPPLANLLIQKLYFSVFLAMIISFVFCMAVCFGVFAALKPVIDKKLAQKTPDAAADTSSDTQGEAAVRLPAGADAILPIVEASVSDEPCEAGLEADDARSDISATLEMALQQKELHNLFDAINYYEKALEMGAEKELRNLIVIDLCGLYKLTGQTEMVYKLLESGQNNMLDLEIKEEILRNL